MKNELTHTLFYIRKGLVKLMMRIFIFLFCTALFSLVPKSVVSQNTKIVITTDREVSVNDVFKMVKAQTAYSFVYHEDLFEGVPKVSLKRGVISLNKLLSQSLSTSHFNVIYTKNNTILIKNQSKAQQRAITGKVTDPSGFPLLNVNVYIKGNRRGAATNIDGIYSITVQDPAHVLVFSSVGFVTQEIVVGTKRTLNVTLQEKINELDEVVVGNYYKREQRLNPGNVGSMKAKAIEKQPVNNPIAAMQGHISGVTISQQSGVPGSGSRIRIRGNRFIDEDGGASVGSRNNPLYIVDGVPYDSEALEATQVSSLAIPRSAVSPLNTINPADIESIEVLKDADATAIYGTRGANGVVIINTKKGKIGKTQIKLNMSTTLSQVTGFVELLNTEQYLQVRREAIENDGGTWPPANALSYPDLLLWDQNRYTDWQKVLIGSTAYRKHAQLSFSGGNAQTQFLLSGSYVNETTVFLGDSKYKKGTVRLNVNHQSKNETFSINASVNYGTDTNNLPATNLTSLAYTLPPNAPALYNDDGSLNWENSTWENPLAILETKYKSSTYNLITNAALSYRPIPDLEFKTNLGFTDNQLASYYAAPHTAGDPNEPNYDSSSSFITTNDGSRRSWIIEPQINWGHDWPDMSLNVLVGTTFQQKKNEQLVIRAAGFSTNDLLFNLPSASTIDVKTDTNSDYRYQSIFGRFNFNWQDKYIVNITGRRDGSSRFGPGRQFGYFGAIGTAWIFSEENILKNHKVLSFGKLRASYGTTGSEPANNYAFYDTYGVAGNYNGFGLLEPTRLYNPNYGWADTKKLEVAIELGLFKGRISLNTAWYRDRSSNQLIKTPLPFTAGFTGVNSNLNAIVQNTGLEIDLNTKNIIHGPFKWQTTFNISANRNKLVAFPGLAGSTFANQFIVGESLRITRHYQLLGVDPDTGLYQFKDFNNDGEINRDDRQLLMDFAPKFSGGLGNTITYKNLQFHMFFSFIKQRSFKQLKVAIASPPGWSRVNFPVTLLDRWQQPGDQNPIQGYFSNADALEALERYGLSSDAYTDTSFIRLRSVSLNYEVPKTVTKGFDLNIYLQGQNLFVISPYKGADPEILGVGLPPLQQFTLGLNLGF